MEWLGDWLRFAKQARGVHTRQHSSPGQPAPYSNTHGACLSCPAPLSPSCPPLSHIHTLSLFPSLTQSHIHTITQSPLSHNHTLTPPQLPKLLSDPNSTEFVPSSFFSEQLTAFELWLAHGSADKKPPEQLPIVLQVGCCWGFRGVVLRV